MRIKKAVAYDTRQSRFTVIDSATLDPGIAQRNGKEVKREAELSGKNEFWIDSVREQEADAERMHRHTRRAESASLRPQTKSYSPRRERIALSANERIDGFLDFAIQTKFAYVNKRGRAGQPASDCRQKAILPRRGRIALSANERIAEFLDFAIRAKFAYVNKRRGGLNQPAFCVVWGMFEPFANREGEDGKWDYGAIEM